jgi:hypothetical protein
VDNLFSQARVLFKEAEDAYRKGHDQRGQVRAKAAIAVSRVLQRGWG